MTASERWTGRLGTLRQLGVAVPAAAFAAVGRYTSPEEFSEGSRRALGACAGLSLLGALAGLALPGRRGAADSPATAALVTTAAEADRPFRS